MMKQINLSVYITEENNIQHVVVPMNTVHLSIGHCISRFIFDFFDKKKYLHGDRVTIRSASKENVVSLWHE